MLAGRKEGKSSQQRGKGTFILNMGNLLNQKSEKLEINSYIEKLEVGISPNSYFWRTPSASAKLYEITHELAGVLHYTFHFDKKKSNKKENTFQTQIEATN